MSDGKKTGIGGAILLAILAIIAAVFGLDPQDLGLGGGNSNGNVPVDTGDGGVAIDVGGEYFDNDDWYQIYFTNPSCPPKEEQHGGVDETIAADIRLAQFQVDMVAFEFDSEAIADALIEITDRGIYVRVVTDEDYEDEEQLERLVEHGIEVILDDRRALMHNKYITIDANRVWTGSMNLTPNGVYCNNNNIVRIESREIAENYMTETDEMFEEQQFGPTSPENTPFVSFTVYGTEIENYFAPETDIAPLLARTIARARNEILFMAFSFTDDKVGESMLGRAEGGVQIRGVFETVGADTEFSYYGKMKSALLPNLQVRKDGNGRIMHHKVIIVDREVVVFGSYNFSDNANRRNDENVVIVHNPAFAQFFVEEFEAVWGEAKQE